MKRLAFIILAAASIAAAEEGNPPPAARTPPERGPAEAAAHRAALQERVEAIERCVASNDLAGVQRELNAVDWRSVQDAKDATKALAKALPKGKPGAVMRRELKTKLALLADDADDADDIPELAGDQAYAVPVVRLDPVAVASLVFVPLGIETLDVQAIPVAFIRPDDAGFLAGLETWERRWGVVLDALGPGNVRVVPHPATALGQARAALMARLDRDGWTPATEGAWADYHRALAAALGRRERLSVIVRYAK